MYNNLTFQKYFQTRAVFFKKLSDYLIFISFSSRTASKHVNKDLGNMEENKKLEENNHKTEA